jgi:hypothetical protein
MWWECDCGYVAFGDPVAGDDWGGEPRPVGPDCPECDCPMDLSADQDGEPTAGEE